MFFVCSMCRCGLSCRVWWTAWFALNLLRRPLEIGRRRGNPPHYVGRMGRAESSSSGQATLTVVTPKALAPALGETGAAVQVFRQSKQACLCAWMVAGADPTRGYLVIIRGRIDAPLP